MRHRKQARLVFVTGTDTGVGKTLLTALLLARLRARGARAWALKPFCSGSRADAKLLHALQDNELTIEEVNPFFFKRPVAPLVAARSERRRIRLEAALAHIRRMASRQSSIPRRGSGPARLESRRSRPGRSSVLLVEGAGGLLAPLGEGFTLLDLISRLANAPGSSSACASPESRTQQRSSGLRLGIIVVARDRLGTINHTLLTMRALPASLSRCVVLMRRGAPDMSSRSNHRTLTELLAPVPVVSVPFLGSRRNAPGGIEASARRLKRLLGHILAGVNGPAGFERRRL